MTDQPQFQDGVDERYVRSDRMANSNGLIDRISRNQAERDSNFHLGKVLLAGVTGGLAVGGVLWTLNSTLIEQDRIAAAPQVDLNSFRQQISTNGLSITVQHEGRAISPVYVELTGFATFLSRKDVHNTNSHRNYICRTYAFDAEYREDTESVTNAAATNSFNLFLVTRTDPAMPEIEEPALREGGPTRVKAVVGLRPRICALTSTSAVMQAVLVRAAE